MSELAKKLANKHINKDESFDEFYTLYEQCKLILGHIKELGFLDEFKTICCPCDSEESNIVKWLQANTNAEIVYFNNLDFNSEEARTIMKSCDCVITNPPFSAKYFVPFFYFITENKIPYFIWAAGLVLSSSRRGLIQHLDYIYTSPKHLEQRYEYKLIQQTIQTGYDVYKNSNGELKPVSTIFLTSFDVPYIDYEYKPAKEEEYYEGIPVYNKTVNIPKDYYGWMYVPASSLCRIKYYDYDEDKSRQNVNNHFARLCIKRRSI